MECKELSIVDHLVVILGGYGDVMAILQLFTRI